MQDTEVKIDTKDVALGMYVTRIDRPWLETPFLLQGFMINTPEDKELLTKYCEYCYVDVHRSKTIKPDFQGTTHRSTTPVRKNPEKPGRPKVKPFKRRHTIEDSATMEEELHRVQKSHKTMTSVLKDMMFSLRSSKKLDLKATQEAIKPMVDSMIRNPDALLWLNRLRQLDDYNYSHALGCSMWSMAMGRQLGLPRMDIESLGIGGLLLDVGKTQIPEKLLTKKELLSEQENAIIQSHVQKSMEILLRDNKVNIKILGMIEHHHERINGEGYPEGLTGDYIPLFAKIAAIVDCYDAITSHRSYAKAISSQEAVKKIYEWRGKDFQAELVEEFIQAVGMFPAGTLIELTDGSVAVVVNESRTRRLRPKVMLLLNPDKSMREDYIICDLKQETHTADGAPLDIAHALPIGSFGISPDDYFL